MKPEVRKTGAARGNIGPRGCVLFFLLAACVGTPIQGTFDFTLTNTSAPGAIAASDGSSHDVKFAPGIVVVHGEKWALFQEGEPATYAGLEGVAEDGNPADLQEACLGDESVSDVSFLQFTDAVTYEHGPLGPGVSATTSIAISSHQRFTVLFMYGESNDVVIAGSSLEAFDKDTPISGDVAGELALLDVGTEVNQEPGLGPDQAPRQAAPNTGEAEAAPIRAITGTDPSGFAYPAIGEMLTLVVTPAG